MNTGFIKKDFIPQKERKLIRDKKVRALYRIGYSMDEIVREFALLGQGISKRDVFFAINNNTKNKNKNKNKHIYAKR